MDALELARSGRGGLVVVRGPAGIGKTALVDALAAEARDFEVLRGAAWEFADAPPYFPLWPCFAACGLTASAGETVLSLWEGLLRALSERSRTRPVLLIAEDLHAADAGTLTLLGLLAQALPGLHVLCVLSHRGQDPRLDERAQRALSRLARDHTLLELGPLGESDILTLVRARSHAALPAPLRARLVAGAAGNPLFALEYAKALPSSGERLPASLAALVLAQFETLSRETRAALVAAAVLGDCFEAQDLGRVLGVPAARAIDALLAALSRGLLREVRPGSFAFIHALTRAALYESVTEAERARLHALAGAAVLARGQSDALSVIERAHHALCAAGEADLAGSVALAERAAELADSLGAHDRALALTRRVLALDASGDDERVLALLLALARRARLSGDLAEHRRACAEMRQRAALAQRAVWLARAALELGAELRPALVDAELVAALEQASAALAAEPDAPGRAGLRLCVEARLAAALQPAADPSEPVGRAERAMLAAEALGDPDVLADVLYYAGSALTDFAPIEQRLSAARALIAASAHPKRRDRAVTGHLRALLDLAQLGEFETFDRSLFELELLTELGTDARVRFRVRLVQAMRAECAGRFSDAERHVAEVERLAAVLDEPALTMSLVAHRHHLMRMLHDRAGVMESLAPMLTWAAGVPTRTPLVALLQASAHAWCGEPELAARHLAGVPVGALAARDPLFARLCAEAVACAGTPEQVELVLRGLDRVAQRHMVGGHVPYSYDGPALRLRGLLHARAGRWDEAVSALRSARSDMAALGFTPWQMRISAELSWVLSRSGEVQAAEVEASLARRLARELELPPEGLPWSQDTERDLAQELPARPAPARPPLALTPSGALWRVDFDGRVLHLKHSRGLELLARLVAQPDTELHVLTLASDEEGALVDSDAGPAIDERAARAYRARLRELTAALAQVPARERPALERERAELARALGAGFGLRGARRLGSHAERARINVQRRIKDAVERISEADPALGAYLRRAVRTGTYCCFRA